MSYNNLTCVASAGLYIALNFLILKKMSDSGINIMANDWPFAVSVPFYTAGLLIAILIHLRKRGF
jgi:hypothetical protein